MAQESQGGAARKVDEGRTKTQFRGSGRWAARDDTMGHPTIRCRRPAVEWEHLPVGQNARPGGDGFPVTYNNKAKLKTLFVKQLLEEETDAEHGLSMKQIINRLEQHGIKAERKNTYRNIEALMEFGCDIQTYQRNPVEYALVRRDFELDELMLMVDAVQSSKAITTRQANSLVTNIKLLASDHQRAMLDRRIHVPGRIRSKAECVDSNVDVIHEAMRHRKKAEFVYHRRDVDGKRHATRDGRPHVVTPMEVVYVDGFYYLTAWDDDHQNMIEYRLDRMGRVRVSDGKASYNNEIKHHVSDKGKYEYFGRFGGEEVSVTLKVRADKVEIVMDRFGEAAELSRIDEEYARARVRIRKSEQFFGWIAGMDKTITIAGPRSLAGEYQQYLKMLIEE